MKKYPTPKQKEVLDIIRKSINDRGYPPTIKEMSEEVGISTVSLYERVVALQDKGLIRSTPFAARSWTPCE